jgi:3-methyl-2-oxobutanoate hydroxymethyltransferase
MKPKGEKIAMLTAYDYIMAGILDSIEIDAILVGDSVGMVFAGYENTIPVTMDMMIYHSRVVTRAVKRALVIGDMPFISYQTSMRDAIKNAGRFLKEGRVSAVKIEGGVEIANIAKRLVDLGIPVMGHIGLTPQSVHKFGGYKTQGKTEAGANKLKDDAKALESAGCFSIVLEKVAYKVSKEITENISIPTIGIGSGPYCDGQVLVIQDMLGLFEKVQFKFVKQYAKLSHVIKSACSEYIKDVKDKKFPTMEHSFE